MSSYKYCHMCTYIQYMHSCMNQCKCTYIQNKSNNNYLYIQ